MKRVNVTKTFLPPLEDYARYLEKIWESGYLTNQGPLLHEFQDALKAFLGVRNVHFVTNGTLALQLAIKALDITEGEIITTPFSYVATTSAILWERCRPVFVDIDPESLCLDPAKIAAAITPQTKAILPVHVFGNAANVEAIDAIATEHNLKVVYDAAHAFGATYNGRSLMDCGDISIGSFHATKLFHTIEGGALIVKDEAVSKRLELVKRFGHDYDEHFMLGTNAKASEFQAAMGLCNLPYVERNIAARKGISERYDAALGSRFRRPARAANLEYNYAYYPIICESEAELLQFKAKLEAENIFPRRYFYPSLNTLPYIESPAACPVAEDIALRIMCLPLYATLEPEVIDKICEVLS